MPARLVGDVVVSEVGQVMVTPRNTAPVCTRTFVVKGSFTGLAHLINSTAGCSANFAEAERVPGSDSYTITAKQAQFNVTPSAKMRGSGGVRAMR